MRYFKPWMLIALLVPLGHQAAAYAAAPVTQFLPGGARILAERSLHGDGGLVAVAYRATNDYVAVVWTGAAPRLIGTEALHGTFVSMRVWNANNAVAALSSTGGTGAEWVCAMVDAGNSLKAAVAGTRGGCVYGTEGVRFHAHGFTVRQRDGTHVGSVRYRVLTRYVWSRHTFTARPSVRVPDYPASALPQPNAIAQTKAGDTILLKLEEATTADQQSTGLMNRHSLDADSGMIFIWTQPVHLSFWMDNTYVPLSVAFLSADGVIQEIQDMQPLTTTLHTPAQPYTYAIEMNLGYFSNHGITVGDRLALHL